MAQEKIGVVGAGLMGAEIALVFALAGHEVVLSDRSDDILAAALDRLGRVLDRGVPRGFFKPEDKVLALARIATTVALDPFATCDFVTEAVFEREAAPVGRPTIVTATWAARATAPRSQVTVPLAWEQVP